MCASGSVVEHRLAKARVAGSNPVSRSFIFVGTFVLQRIPAFLFLKIFIGKCLAEGECIMLQNKYIQLAPPSLSFAEQAADYYCRNREFLREYEPRREAAFFTAGRQREILEQEIRSQQAKLSFRFYIKPMAEPEKIIGIAALNNVVYGAFCSAFLGYKLDSEYLNRGYMTMAVNMISSYAFQTLGLHRLEANVMPRNKASLRVLEKNQFVNEGISRYYLNINGVWEDHIHMVKLNYGMHNEKH